MYLPVKISAYKYCKSVKKNICIILYYLWNFENKYYVCLSILGRDLRVRQFTTYHGSWSKGKAVYHISWVVIYG